MDISRLRKDFPILQRRINGKVLAYLDNAATSQKPKQVLKAIDAYYRSHNANVHRGIHTLSVEATEAYELARAKVGKFVGVSDPSEVIFVRNATEAINLVAYSWGRLNISKGDEIMISIAEHHSNFVPWQQLALENGAVIKIVPILKDGSLDEAALKKGISKKTKLVCLFHVSNVLGTINDVKKLVLAIKGGVAHSTRSARSGRSRPLVLIDGAQAVPHMPVDIPKLGCDFYVFTGHKMLGPMGIGVLWAKKELLENMAPFMFGGEMISKVSVNATLWNELPWKFEAGTPNVGGAIGLAAAVDYLKGIGMENVRKHEIELTNYAVDRFSEIPDVLIYGSSHSEAKPKNLRKRSFANAQDDSSRAGVVSFNIGNVHAHDVASILDSEGIAIRSGHHCAEPLMDFLGVSSVARASFYIYNTKKDVDRLVEGVRKVKKVFRLTQNSKGKSQK